MPREGRHANMSVGSSGTISQGCSQLLSAGRVGKDCHLEPSWAQPRTLPSQTSALDIMGGFVWTEAPSVRPQGPSLCSPDSIKGHLLTAGRGERVPREMPSNRSIPEDSGLSKYSVDGVGWALVLVAACSHQGMAQPALNIPGRMEAGF